MSEGATMHKGFKVLLAVGAVGGIIAGAAGVIILAGAIKAKRAAAAAAKK